MFGKGRGKKGKVPETRPSSWAIQGGAADKIINTGPPSKKAKKGEKGEKGDGKKKEEEPKMANELAKNQATEEQIEGICELLRSNKVEKALQFVQKESAIGSTTFPLSLLSPCCVLPMSNRC